CQRLYTTNAKLELVPELAAGQPVLSADKLSYTIQLRQGVTFNDGTPMNAKAVVASVQRLMSPSSPVATNYAAVDSVTASGLYTVVFHLKTRSSTFQANVNPYVMSPTALAAEGSNFGSNPVCVGPFMFDHRVAGESITVIKSSHYYDQQDVFLDKIVFKPTP